MRTVIVWALGDNDFSMGEIIREKTDSSRYLGAWGKIESNREECIAAIVTAVRYFGGDDPQKAMIFACHKDDTADIAAAIHKAIDGCDLQVFGRIEIA